MSNPSPSPFQAGYFSDNPYQSPEQTPPGYGPRRGMVNHIRVIAILNGVQGILELMLGSMLFFAGGMMYFGSRSMPPGAPGNNPEEILLVSGVMFAFGALPLIASLIRIAAALCNFFIKSRMLGIVSFIFGFLTALTFYCSLTSIAVGVYGLLVLFNTEVVEAFAMAKSGKKADEILRIFNARPY